MSDILRDLQQTIRSHRDNDPQHSYVAKRFASGRQKIAQKIGEEGVELALALASDDNEEITKEAADLLFHILIGLEDAGLSLADVEDELAKRQGVSGITEKQQRQ